MYNKRHSSLNSSANYTILATMLIEALNAHTDRHYENIDEWERYMSRKRGKR